MGRSARCSYWVGCWPPPLPAAESPPRWLMRVAASSGAVAIAIPAPHLSLAARIAFGVGALIVLGWAAYAWRQFFKLH